MTILDNLVMLNRGNGTTFLDVQNGDAAGTNVNSPVATTGDGGEDGMTYNGTSNYTTMPALSSYSFITGRWTLAVRAKFAAETANDAAISFGAGGGNALRLWLGVNANDAPHVRVRNSALVNLEITGSLAISNSSEVVLIVVAKDKLDDADYTNGTVILYDSAGNVLGSGDYNLTTLTGFAKHAIGGDVTSSYAGGISGDVFWSAAWNRALSVAEIQSLDDSPYPFASRAISNIDGDNNVYPGQSVVINGSGFVPPISAATFDGQAITLTGEPTDTAIPAIIPLHINSEWGATDHVLSITDATGQLTRNGLTLSANPNWQQVTLTSVPGPEVETAHKYSQIDAEVGNFVGAVSDKLTIESHPSITWDGETAFIQDPAQTVTLNYKWWDASEGTFTPPSTLTIKNMGIYGAAKKNLFVPIVKPLTQSVIQPIIRQV